MATEQFIHTTVIALPRDTVWQRLMDPAVVSRCVSGCEHLVRDKGNRFRYAGHYKIGPFSRQFKGTVTLTDVYPGSSFYFFRGSNHPYTGAGAFSGWLRLDDHPDGTQMTVSVDIEVSAAIMAVINFLRPKREESPLKIFFDNFARVATEVPA